MPCGGQRLFQINHQQTTLSKRMAFGARHKKLWPDAAARVKKAVGVFDYSPAAVVRMIDAIEQEMAWDWD